MKMPSALVVRSAFLALVLLASACASHAPVPHAPDMPRLLHIESPLDLPAELQHALADVADQPEALRSTLLEWYAERRWRITQYREWHSPDHSLHLLIDAHPLAAPAPVQTSSHRDTPAASPPTFVATPVPPPDQPAGVRRAIQVEHLPSPVRATWPSDARVLVDRRERQLYLRTDSGEILSWPVAVGTARTPTPARRYVVEDIVRHPTWYPPPSVRRDHAARGQTLPRQIPPGPGNPLGLYFIRLQNSIGIHGTNRPDSIGTAASYGCIRMHDEDVADLVNHLQPGDAIEVLPHWPTS